MNTSTMAYGRKPYVLLAIFAAALMVAGDVSAGVGGQTEFGALYQYIKSLSEGFLGRTMAIFAFIVGLGIGIARASAIPAVVGIVFAIFVAYGPTIIDGIASATI